MSVPTLLAFDVESLRWLDVTGTALVLLFLVLGIRRGLWWQLVRLLGVVAAIAVARAATPRLVPHVQGLFEGLDERMANGLVWIVLVVFGLVIVALVTRLSTKEAAPSEASIVDRAGGGLAGAITGALLHVMVVLCVCQLGAEEWSIRSVQGTRSQRLVESFGRRVPLFLDAHAADALEPWLEQR